MHDLFKQLIIVFLYFIALKKTKTVRSKHWQIEFHSHLVGKGLSLCIRCLYASLQSFIIPGPDSVLEPGDPGTYYCNVSNPYGWNMSATVVSITCTLHLHITTK